MRALQAVTSACAQWSGKARPTPALITTAVPRARASVSRSCSRSCACARHHSTPNTRRTARPPAHTAAARTTACPPAPYVRCTALLHPAARIRPPRVCASCPRCQRHPALQPPPLRTATPPPPRPARATHPALHPTARPRARSPRLRAARPASHPPAVPTGPRALPTRACPSATRSHRPAQLRVITCAVSGVSGACASAQRPAAAVSAWRAPAAISGRVRAMACMPPDRASTACVTRASLRWSEGRPQRGPRRVVHPYSASDPAGRPRASTPELTTPRSTIHSHRIPLCPPAQLPEHAACGPPNSTLQRTCAPPPRAPARAYPLPCAASPDPLRPLACVCSATCPVAHGPCAHPIRLPCS